MFGDHVSPSVRLPLANIRDNCLLDFMKCGVVFPEENCRTAVNFVKIGKQSYVA